MMLTHDSTRKLRVQLRRTWLLWSCVPMVAVLIGLAATTAACASQPVLTPKRAEDSFYEFLAISALVFLFAFSIDGHWTNPKRVAARLRKQLGEVALRAFGAEPAGVEAAEARATSAGAIVLGSSTSLGLMGHVIGLIAILCILSGAGPVHAYLLLAVAVSYQLYLFSRHPYYEQVVEAAYAGDLEEEEDEQPKKGKGNSRK